MKKIIVLILAITVLSSIGIYAYADVSGYDCNVSDEDHEARTNVKEEFLNEKVAAGDLTQEEADQLLTDINSRTGRHSLRDLGFGEWLKDSEYEDLFNYGEKRGHGRSHGRRSKNRSCIND